MADLDQAGKGRDVQELEQGRRAEEWSDGDKAFAAQAGYEGPRARPPEAGVRKVAQRFKDETAANACQSADEAGCHGFEALGSQRATLEMDD